MAPNIDSEMKEERNKELRQAVELVSEEGRLY